MERCSISTQIPCFYPRAREGYDRPRHGRTTTAARDYSPRARKLNDDVSAFSLPANRTPMRGVTRAFSSTEYTAVPFHPALPMRGVTP